MPERIIGYINQESKFGKLRIFPHAAETPTYPVEKIVCGTHMDCTFVLQRQASAYSLYLCIRTENGITKKTLIISHTSGEPTELKFTSSVSPRFRPLGNLFVKRLEDLTITGKDAFLQDIVASLSTNNP